MAETYQPSDQARRVQEIVVNFEKRRLEVDRLRAQLLSRQAGATPELNAIDDDYKARRAELVREAERALAVFKKKEDDLAAEQAQRREKVMEELDVLKGKLNSEKNVLLGVKQQLDAALRKLGVDEVVVKPSQPIELEISPAGPL